MEFKVVNSDVAEVILRRFIREIAADGVIEDYEKEAFAKIARCLSIDQHRFEFIKEEVKKEVQANPTDESLDVVRFLKDAQRELNTVLDPVETRNLLNNIGRVLNLSVEEFQNVFRPRVDKELQMRFQAIPRFAFDGGMSPCEDVLFCLSDVLSKANEGVYHEVLNLRDLGRQQEAINLLQSTKDIPEFVRLYLSSRMFLELGKLNRAQYYLSLAKEEHLSDEIFIEESLFLSFMTGKGEGILDTWCVHRGYDMEEMTFSQAQSAIESLVENLIQRNAFLLAHKVLQDVFRESDAFDALKSRYRPFVENLRVENVIHSPGRKALLIQLIPCLFFLSPSLLALPECFHVLGCLFGVSPLDELEIREVWTLVVFSSVWLIYGGVFLQNLKDVLADFDFNSIDWSFFHPRYFIIKSFTGRYHMNLQNKSESLKIIQDGYFQSYPNPVRFLPYFLHRIWILGPDQNTQKNQMVPLHGLCPGDPLLEQLDKTSRSGVQFSSILLLFTFPFVIILRWIKRRWKESLGISVLWFALPFAAIFLMDSKVSGVMASIGPFLWLLFPFFIILAGSSLYQVLKDRKVMSLEIHWILLNLFVFFFFLQHYSHYGWAGAIPPALLFGLSILTWSYPYLEPKDQGAWYQWEVAQSSSQTGFKKVDLPVQSKLGNKTELYTGPNSTYLIRKFLGFTLGRERFSKSRSPLYFIKMEPPRLEIGNYSLKLKCSVDEAANLLKQQKIPHFPKSMSTASKKSWKKPLAVCFVLFGFALWQSYENVNKKPYRGELVEADFDAFDKLVDPKKFFRNPKRELVHIPEAASYNSRIAEDGKSILVYRKDRFTNEEWENQIAQSSSEHPLRSKKVPPFLRPFKVRDNLWDLFVWEFMFKEKYVNWERFGEYLGDYCKAFELGVHKEGDSYRCALEINTIDIANYLRTIQIVPDFFDEDILEAALLADGELLFDLPEEMKQNERLALASISFSTAAWTAIDSRLRASRTFIKKALAKNGRLLAFLSNDLKSDREMVLTALRQDPTAYKAMNQALYQDYGIALEVVKVEGLALKYMPDKYRKDKELVLLAVQQNGLAIQYSHPDLRKDPELMKLSSFQERGIQFQFIPPDLLSGDYPELQRGFFLSHQEITQSQYDLWMESNPSTQKGDDLPVHNLSYRNALDFVRRLNQDAGRTIYQIPPAPAWEASALGASGQRFFFGNDSKLLPEYAWFRFNSDDQLHPVGQLKRNPYGLDDVYGNVLEWVRPISASYYRGRGQSVPDNMSDSPGVCGGSYKMTFVFCQPLPMLENFGTRQSEMGLRVLRILEEDI